MRKFTILCFVAFWACICTAQSRRTPVFTSLDYPGAVDTEATGITPSGEIVGRYVNFDGVNYYQHGFLFANGQFQQIDYPGSIWTDITYINPRGEIVGSYGSADGKAYGYLLRAGQFTSIDYPGAVGGTNGDGIGPNGEVVGAWWGDEGTPHGYILDTKGQFTLYDFSGYPTLLTQTTAGRMIGDYFKDPISSSGFVVKDGNAQSIDFPADGATPACVTSYVSGLNARGDIVGGCIRDFLNENGWLIRNGEYIPINYPGSVSTYANGINAQGQIVGRYSMNDGQFNHGFVLTWQP